MSDLTPTTQPAAASDPMMLTDTQIAETPDRVVEIDPGKRIADAILKVMFEFLEGERNSNFDFLGFHSHSYAAKDIVSCEPAAAGIAEHVSEKFGHGPASAFSCQWYTFKQFNPNGSILPGSILTTPIRLRSAPLGGSTHDSFVDFSSQDNQYPLSTADPEFLNRLDITQLDTMGLEDGTWMNIRTWLRQKLEWHEETLSGSQLDEMKIWWGHNGKTFHLHNLPSELQRTIFQHSIGYIIVPEIVDSEEPRLAIGKTEDFTDVNDLGAQTDPDIVPDLNVLMLSRNIRHQLLEDSWKDSDVTRRFRFLSTLAFIAEFPLSWTLPVAFDYGIMPPHQPLARIQIELPAIDYFRLAGSVPSSYTGTWQNWGTPRFHMVQFKEITTLKHLDFRFMSPKHPRAECPWGFGLKHSCQKVWIHWFFLHAYRNLSDRNFNVTMSGCIKPSTREVWEPRLAEENEGEGSPRRLNDETWNAVKAELDALKSQPSSQPPCACTLACHNMTPEEEEDPDNQQALKLKEFPEEKYWSPRD